MELLSAILVAAGSGKRMGSPVPKQFIEISNKTILEHTLDSFVLSDFFDEIIIVLSEDYRSLVNTILEQYPGENIRICIGGKERFHSVKNALEEVNKDCNMIFIHDAVRPFCTHDLINECYKVCKEKSSAIPAIQIKDSIRKIETDGTSVIIDRSDLKSIQTPQVFDFKKLHTAYQVQFSETFTDDASVYEAAKNKIHLVKGESTNIKITTPDDLEFARLWLG